MIISYNMREISDDNLQFLIDWSRLQVKNTREFYRNYQGYFWGDSEFLIIFALLLDEKLRRAEL